MATKTISLELDAYDRLRSARLNDRESFSNVVRRARWETATPTAGDVLRDLRAAVRARPDLLLPVAELDRLSRRRRSVRLRTRWEAR
jgi:hypothetical protein